MPRRSPAEAFLSHFVARTASVEACFIGLHEPPVLRASPTRLVRTPTDMRRAFTIVELLVVIAIVAILMGLILVGVQGARESARRTQCIDNLRQMGLGMQAFHAAERMYPPGSKNATSFLVFMLPYVGETTLFENFHEQLPWNDVLNQPLRAGHVPLYTCPSDPLTYIQAADGSRCTSYAGNYGSGAQKYHLNGMFRYYHRKDNNTPSGGRFPIRDGDVRDGLSQTVAISEQLVATLTPINGFYGKDGNMDHRRLVFNLHPAMQAPHQLDAFADSCAALDISGLGFHNMDRGRPWVWGTFMFTLYNHVLGPNQKSCINGSAIQEGAYSAASLHPGGVNALFADGHVVFVTDEVERSIWRAVGSRDGGESEASF